MENSGKTSQQKRATTFSDNSIKNDYVAKKQDKQQHQSTNDRMKSSAVAVTSRVGNESSVGEETRPRNKAVAPLQKEIEIVSTSASLNGDESARTPLAPTLPVRQVGLKGFIVRIEEGWKSLWGKLTGGSNK